MILDFNKLVNGSSLSLPAYGRDGQGQRLFLRRFSQSEKRISAAANARAGRAFLSPLPPFLPAPPERWAVGGSAALRAALKVCIRIFAEKSSDFVQSSEQNNL